MEGKSHVTYRIWPGGVTLNAEFRQFIREVGNTATHGLRGLAETFGEDLQAVTEQGILFTQAAFESAREAWQGLMNP